MQNLNLPDHYLQIILDCIRQTIPSYEVLAYGSRVKGTAHSASDLDLIVRDPNNATQKTLGLSAFKAALNDSNLPILVDVLDWANSPIHIKSEVQKSHIIIYPKNFIVR